jgi:ferritin-like metal-binding protein YciE
MRELDRSWTGARRATPVTFSGDHCVRLRLGVAGRGQRLFEEEGFRRGGVMTDTLQELFEHELRDIYDAEHKLVRALEAMAKKTPDQSVAQRFGQHRDTTREQIKRLEEVFGLLDKSPRREPCKGINGLVDEFNKFVKEEKPSEEVLNTFAIGAGLKVEYYEIVAYQSLLRLADAIGFIEARNPLQRNLIEEQNTAQELEALADGKLGRQPAMMEELAVVDEASAETIDLADTDPADTDPVSH